MKKFLFDPEMQKEYEKHVENTKYKLEDITVESISLHYCQ